MIIRFQEIYNEVLNAMRLNADTVEANQATSIKLRINQIQDYIFFLRDWEWRRKSIPMTTKPPYETGTLSITQGSRTVTGSGTTWTDAMKEGYLIVNNVSYKISSVASSTSLRLRQPFAADSVSGVAYKIVYPSITLDPSLSGVINVALQGRDLALKQEERSVLSYSSVGEPQEAFIAGRSEDTYYSTGTIALSTGSTAVIGTGTAFTSDMEGRVLRVDEFAQNYIIESVTDGTNLVLRSAYEGSSGSGKSYKIDPEGMLLLGLRDAPDDYYPLVVTGMLAPKRLVNNDDISLIPNHAPLLHGAIWLALTDYEAKNPVRVQQARADFERTLKQLESSYRIVSNVKWRSQAETQYRMSGGMNRFDPLAG